MTSGVETTVVIKYSRSNQSHSRFNNDTNHKNANRQGQGQGGNFWVDEDNTQQQHDQSNGHDMFAMDDGAVVDAWSLPHNADCARYPALCKAQHSHLLKRHHK